MSKSSTWAMSQSVSIGRMLGESFLVHSVKGVQVGALLTNFNRKEIGAFYPAVMLAGQVLAGYQFAAMKNQEKTMLKVTEARKKILEIIARPMLGTPTERLSKAGERLSKIQEIVLNDDEWNEEQEQEEKSLLDLAIDGLEAWENNQRK